LAQQLYSPTWQFSSPQSAPCRAVSGPKIDCSPDLDDFSLCPKIKSALKGQRFQDIEDIQKNLMKALEAIPQQEYQKCFQQWQHHWAKCIAALGGTLKVTPS
jgi:hypothetical protein